jgi:hypothetical protein
VSGTGLHMTQHHVPEVPTVVIKLFIGLVLQTCTVEFFCVVSQNLFHSYSRFIICLIVCGSILTDMKLLESSFINTNLIHNFFFYKLHDIKFLYMFRASSAHPQEVNDVNCICMQPLLSSFSAIAEGRLQSSFGDCTRRPLAEKDDTSGCIHI